MDLNKEEIKIVSSNESFGQKQKNQVNLAILIDKVPSIEEEMDQIDIDPVYNNLDQTPTDVNKNTKLTNEMTFDSACS